MNICKLSLACLCCFTSLARSQVKVEPAVIENGVEERFEGFSAAYGTLVNIEMTLKDVETQQPSLVEEVKKIRKELEESEVGKGFAGMVIDMKRMMGDQFTQYDVASRKQIREIEPVKKIDLETATIALGNIAKVKEGGLPQELLRTVISMNPDYRKNPLKEIQDGWVAGFSSKMNQEKMKVNYLLRYPGSWAPVAANSKAVLFAIDSDAGFGNARLLLQAIDAPDPKYAKMDPVELAKMLVPPSGKILESEKAKVAGLPGGRVIYDLKKEGQEFTFRQVSYMLHTKDTFVIIMVMLDPRGGLKPEEEVKRLVPLLDKMAATLEVE